MIPSSTNRRESLLTQFNFDNILNLEQNELTSHIFPVRSNIDYNSNLQVVPDLECNQTRDDTTALERDLTGLHFSCWPRIAVTPETTSFNHARIHAETDSYPRSPFLPKTSISEIDNLGLLSPLFSLSSATSPILKTPSTLYEICCSSRKSSDDLSIYLPDNFTPASLESLDKSVNRTVFQFPATASKPETMNDNVFVDDKTENEPTTLDSALSLSDGHWNEQHDNVTKLESVVIQNAPSKDFEDVKSLIDIASVKEKRAKKKRTKQQLKPQTTKRQKSCDFELQSKNGISTDPSPLLRNQMERERRNDLNNRFQKLRDSLPDATAKVNISKISILKAATAYIKDLIGQEALLENISKAEKSRNEQLLKKLVSISKNLGEEK